MLGDVPTARHRIPIKDERLMEDEHTDVRIAKLFGQKDCKAEKERIASRGKVISSQTLKAVGILPNVRVICVRAGFLVQMIIWII